MTTSLPAPVPGRTQVPVSLRALVQRINRKLAHDGEVLKKLRGERYRAEFGTYYIVNLDRNCLETTDVDPVALGQELGVLAAWETVREEEETT
jgi:hypothetical protein